MSKFVIQKAVYNMIWFLTLALALGSGCDKNPTENNKTDGSRLTAQATAKAPAQDNEKKDDSPSVNHQVEVFVNTARIAGSVNKLKDMIKNGVDVNAFNQYGINALMAAQLVGRVDNAKFLIQNGADLKKKNQKGENAVPILTRRNWELDKIKILCNDGYFKGRWESEIEGEVSALYKKTKELLDKNQPLENRKMYLDLILPNYDGSPI